MLRKICAFLLFIPLIFLINLMANPGPRWPGDPHTTTTGEILFLVFGLPVLVINYLLWFGDKYHPQIGLN
jgi:hypothetical protein